MTHCFELHNTNCIDLPFWACWGFNGYWHPVRRPKFSLRQMVSIYNFIPISRQDVIVIATVVDLTLSGWVTHICVSKLTIIGWNNGLSPGWCQAITWTKAGIFIIGPLGTNVSEIFIEIFIQENAFQNVVCEMASTSSRPQCDNAETTSFCHGCI